VTKGGRGLRRGREIGSCWERPYNSGWRRCVEGSGKTRRFLVALFTFEHRIHDRKVCKWMQREINGSDVLSGQAVRVQENSELDREKLAQELNVGSGSTAVGWCGRQRAAHG
jgi:hypothetical protein